MYVIKPEYQREKRWVQEIKFVGFGLADIDRSPTEAELLARSQNVKINRGFISEISDKLWTGVSRVRLKYMGDSKVLRLPVNCNIVRC